MKEKLIELIQAAVDGCATYWAGLIADHLIANGVTVHKWIPVTERLPEDFEEVLVFGRSKLTRVMVIDIAFRKGRKWFVPCDEDCIEQDPVIVSHWMPLPLSPEGEEL